MAEKARTVSLVLGSGGARGRAHIGVIRALHEMGFQVRNIAGCSMGSVIGGIYAADKLDTYTDWAFQLTRSDVVKLIDFSFSFRSLFKGERIFDVLKELVGDRKIEDLDKRFTAVATSLEEEQEVWLNSGSLLTPCGHRQRYRASFARPTERANTGGWWIDQPDTHCADIE